MQMHEGREKINQASRRNSDVPASDWAANATAQVVSGTVRKHLAKSTRIRIMIRPVGAGLIQDDGFSRRRGLDPKDPIATPTVRE
jgi:hypothetical protein